ncbi:MAG: helix-turn-helix transcriptional regulator [Kiritimatiellae bacterium]|nr:helix-turn-helix transcriptional regulator [Kiritimatiellia bacterium]
MKRKSIPGQFGVLSLAASDEFKPNLPRYKDRLFDLGKFGVPQIPAIGQTVCQQVDHRLTHWHVHKGCIELIYCASGACKYESGGQIYNLTPGMVFVSRPHEAHRQLDAPKGYATFYMLFRPSEDKAIRWFGDRFSRLPRIFFCGPSVSAHFGKIIAMAERGNASLETCIRLQSVIRVLWLEMLDFAALSIRPKTPEVFGAIAEQMRRHPECAYPLDGLVDESGVSKASFISLFKTAHGLTPHAYLLQCRCVLANEWDGNERAELILHEGDNSSKKHVFRIAYTGDGNDSRGSGGFVLWRDGEPVAENVPAFRMGSGGNNAVFGMGSRAYGGSFDMDYIRWTTDGVFAPPDPQPPLGFSLVIE